jgi:hypothetical protein
MTVHGSRFAVHRSQFTVVDSLGRAVAMIEESRFMNSSGTKLNGEPRTANRESQTPYELS